MAVEITVNYEGQLRCRAVHGPSRNELVTDAPADNMGKAGRTGKVGTTHLLGIRDVIELGRRIHWPPIWTAREGES